MSLTLRTIYSDIALGKMRAKSGWIDRFNQGFTMPAEMPSMGTVSVEMWDAFTTETPSAGTWLGQCANNLIASLTTGLSSSTVRKNEQQKNAIEFNAQAMNKIALKCGDAIKQDLQNAVIAGLKAASAGLSIALPTGYIDGVLPSGATNPDIINNIVANMQRLVEYIRDQSGGGPEDMYMTTTPTMRARLKAITLTPYRPAQLSQGPGGLLAFDDVPIFAVGTGTNFGGASQEALFCGHVEGYAMRYLGPNVTGDGPSGWSYGADGFWRFTMQAPYIHGVVNTSFLAELTNPAS